MSMETCDICGKVCLTAAGSFGIPVQDILTGQPITGVCCGVCGPALEAYTQGGCEDLNLLPEGPLKLRLIQLQNLYRGQRCLSILVWMAEHHATVDFHNAELLPGAPANTVTLTATLDGEQLPRTVESPTLEIAVMELMAATAERTVH
jgi:hypothetical protein